MSKKELLVGAIAGMALAAGATSFAYQGDPQAQGPNYTPERHEAMIRAFENNDYQAWKDLRQGRGRISEVINENNFSDFIKMRELRLAGKTDEADEIRAELGLGLRIRFGNHNGSQKGYGNRFKNN